MNALIDFSMYRSFIEQAQISRSVYLSSIQHEYISNFLQMLVSNILHLYKSRNQVILFGNGGSSSQASHLAAELLVRYRSTDSRPPIRCSCLSSDASVVTAISNDYSFSDLFLHQLKTMANPGDVFIAFTTSGTSMNITKALDWLSENHPSNTYLFTGNPNSSLMYNTINVSPVPTLLPTAIAQEYHLFLIHIFCELLELAYANSPY